ncbi:MAG TPA: TolC family protein, partial [Saprospiraceae bacterium]|nr:TolC family protein [Saprospiraceae bacterium]
KTKTNISAVKNGLALQSSLDELDAEKLKTEQSVVDESENLTALYLNLGKFINKTINDNTILTIENSLNISEAEEIKRPELKLFDAQKLLLQQTREYYSKTDYPKLSIGAEGNYGRPGPNFLNQNQRFFGSANINLKWNISSLYNRNNEDQKLNINTQKIDVQREVFEFNLKNTLTTQLAKIKSLRTNIQKDKLIVDKRHSITSTASNQLENGSITTTDYLIQLNAEMQAVLNEKLHEIKLMNAIANYNTTKGIRNF